MCMFVYLMYIFEVQMCIFGYLKTPDIILSLVSARKLDWTHTFDTHCILTNVAAVHVQTFLSTKLA